jgi:hypothetical protein
MGPQSHESPNYGNFKTPTWESQGTKCHLDAGLVVSHRVYHRGEGGGFPQVQAVVNLVSSNLLVAHLNTKNVSTMD